jgi:hypothetical protein
MHPKDDSTEPICLYCIAHFGMHVHSSLVNVVLHDSRPERSQSWPRILLSRRSHQSLNFSWMLHLGISNFHFSPESDACLCPLAPEASSLVCGGLVGILQQENSANRKGTPRGAITVNLPNVFPD